MKEKELYLKHKKEKRKMFKILPYGKKAKKMNQNGVVHGEKEDLDGM